MYDVEKLTHIDLGRQGENLARTVEIDVHAFLAQWPEADIVLMRRRKRGEELYIADTELRDGVLIWPITRMETEHAGYGKAEIRAMRGDVVAKSVIADTYVAAALTGSETQPPTTGQSWVAKVLEAGRGAAAANEAANAAARRAEAAGESAEAAAERAEAAGGEIIDDAAISTATTWSSVNIIERLCPETTAEGNPVRMDGLIGGYPLSIRVNVEPVQEGSGNPSPDNILPINVPERVEVERYGANQSDACAIALPDGFCGGMVDVTGGEATWEWAKLTLDGTEAWGIGGKLLGDGADYYYTITQKIDNVIDTSHVPVVCTHYPGNYVSNSQTQSGIDIVWRNVRIRWGEELPIEDWKAYLAAQYAAGTPVTIYHKVAQPTTHTIPAQLIPALDGVNTVMTDAQSLTVKGRADPVRTISTLTERIAALENAAAGMG